MLWDLEARRVFTILLLTLNYIPFFGSAPRMVFARAMASCGFFSFFYCFAFIACASLTMDFKFTDGVHA
jgi:hypothetical protein